MKTGTQKEGEQVTGKAVLVLDLTPALSVPELMAVHAVARKRGQTLEQLLADEVRKLAAEVVPDAA